MELTELVGLDFETYASTDLPTHGLDRYVKCPDFRPLMAAAVHRRPDGNIAGYLFDFVEDYEGERARLIEALRGKTIVAHNAGFEQAVLEAMDIHIWSDRFVDSAVLARAAGAAGKLEAAAPQLLGIDKLDSGYELIKLFSVPGKYQLTSSAFDPQIRVDHIDEWAEFARYCGVDAELSLQLAELLLPHTSDKELANNMVTMEMNRTGWHVDLDLVKNMQLRYLTNVAQAEQDFRIACDAPDLNLNSYKQLQEWCHERGVRATSFDEAHVTKLMGQLAKKLDGTLPDDKRNGYEQVYYLLKTKQVMGGSSLKKLQTILDTTGTDGRLHDQYLHCGAGATFRTTGRGVQMQNLKRLGGEGDDMAELWLDDTDWDNGKLAANLRQVFTATDPNGFLIVGDFSSVESRGLAWQAGEQWKLDAYFRGEDLYVVQAGQMFNKPAADVVKAERQVGKVGELSCGYGAGPDAVRDFAAKMGVVLTEGEAAKLVYDWRQANPAIVDYWKRLDRALHKCLDEDVETTVQMPHGYVTITPEPAPESLRKQAAPLLRSLQIKMYLHDGTFLLRRVIHGTEFEGNNIHYWKPSERKTGDLWTNVWMNPKTKRHQPFTVYGGKLAGLLTQSLCREVFFDSLRYVYGAPERRDEVLLVGQFHDEIVLDWRPGGTSLDDMKAALKRLMSSPTLPEFPLAAEIKHDYRYTK